MNLLSIGKNRQEERITILNEKPYIKRFLYEKVNVKSIRTDTNVKIIIKGH